MMLRRLLDLVVVLVLLLLTAPLQALIALLIMLDSPGPVCYAPTMIGWRGRPFRLYMNQRILVIDDDPAVTSVLERGLSYEGFAVDIAASGEEGLARARERRPDLVILDRMMPGLDGMEVLRRLRSAGDQLPVLFLTAKDAPEEQVQGLASGADDYVVKPFTFEVLLARVRVLLRRAQHEAPPLLRFADLTLDPGGHQVRRGERVIALTNLAFKLL